jgi:hypothetical protein
MQRLMSQFLNQRGEEFNDQVADFLAQTAPDGVIVERRVKAIGELRKHKGPPGDIDVLVIDPGERRVRVIECKDFAAAHMPHQIANELENLFLGKGGKESQVARRARWVRENLDYILEWFKVGDRGKWKVEPFIVVSQELFAPYLSWLFILEGKTDLASLSPGRRESQTRSSEGDESHSRSVQNAVARNPVKTIANSHSLIRCIGERGNPLVLQCHLVCKVPCGAGWPISDVN